MLDLTRYSSVGAALRDSLDQFSKELCLIESDHGRERERITYRDFKERAHPLARALQKGGFAPGDRAAIVMTNQSKWLISAFAIFHCGGVLVPLAHYLTPSEQWGLLKHSGAQILVTEYPIWLQLSKVPDHGSETNVRTILVTEAPANVDLQGAHRWEEFHGTEEPAFVPRERKDIACIVYSSGTVGQPKGCMMTHENYLEQCVALTSVFPFAPGVRYLSVLPTNHAIDFMAGFVGPFMCGATIIHLRSLRPDFIREAFTKYRITYASFVPAILKNLERGLRERFRSLRPFRRLALDQLIRLNRALTRGRPRRWLSQRLLKEVHQSFGGNLHAIIVGGAFSEPAMLQFFYDLGIPVANGYGMTEAGTAITLNDLKPFRPDTVGKPLPGTDVKISDRDHEGIGEVVVRSKTVMAGYLDDPELTAETIVDGWLKTGDLGRFDKSGHLQLLGRKTNMIVGADGKNVYPEEIEMAFEDLPLPVLESCAVRTGSIWPRHWKLQNDQFLLVLHLDQEQSYAEELRKEILERNRRLSPHKRIKYVLLTEDQFPRTPTLKLRRARLAEDLQWLNPAFAIIPLDRPAALVHKAPEAQRAGKFHTETRICGRCQVYVPHFQGLPAKLEKHLKLLLESGEPMEAIFCLRRATGCAVPVAMRWIWHANCPVEPPTLCPYCGGLLRTKRAQQCCHCFMDWHNGSAIPQEKRT